MPEHGQPIPLRVYRTGDLLVLAAPMPGLEPADIRVSIVKDRVTIHGEERARISESGVWCWPSGRLGRITAR